MYLTIVNLCKSICTKTALITGANEGIGFETALNLAAKKYKIILADKEDLTQSKNKIIELTKNENITGKFVDFTMLSSVRSFANEIIQEEAHLDVLINNVGVFCLGKERTVDGLVPAMQVNHFGPFLLTFLLIDLLKASKPSRVVFTSSTCAFFHNLTENNINNPIVTSPETFSSVLVYYNSKLCNLIAANGFAKRNKLEEVGITFNSFHPGMTNSKFLVKNEPFLAPVSKLCLQHPAKSALNGVFLATSPSLEKVSGNFFVDCVSHEQPLAISDGNFCDHIWDLSKSFVNL